MVKRFKGLFIISVILFSTAAGFAANYTWTGTQSTDWADYRNWKKDGIAAVLGETPAAGDDVTINTSSNPPAITSAAVANSLTIDYGCSLTLGTGAPLTLSGIFTNHGTFTTDANTTVIFNGDNSQIAGSANSGFYNLKINNGKKCTFHKDIEVANTLTNNGTLTAAVSDRVVIFTGNNCSITGSTETILENLTINSGKKLTVEQNITIRKNFNNNGTFDALTHSKTVTFNPPAGGAVTIKGSGDENDTKFHSIKCENAGGKTLKVEGKISVEGLVLSGTPSPVSYLRVDSGTSGEIHLKAIHTGTGAYLNINTDKVKIQPVGSSSSDWGYKVYNSQKNGNPVSPSGTVFNGWKFESEDPPVTLYWTGKSGTGWETAGNWAEMSGSVYRESLYTPTYNATVIIPAKQTVTVSGTNYPVQYPVLTGNVKAKSIEIKKGSADNTSGELDLSDYTINAGASKKTKIENSGTLKLKGSAGQKTWFETSNTDEKINLKEGCIVEYNGNPSVASNVWSGPYQKLKVSGGRQTLNASSMDVKRDLIIARTPVEISTGTGNQIYRGNVIANEGASNYDLTLTGGTITTSNTVTAGNLTVRGGWSSKKVDARGDIKVNDTPHSSSNLWTAGGDILVKGNLTAGQFNQTGGTLTFNGSGTEQTLSFTNAFGQKNINNLTINSSAKVKLGSDITIRSDFTNNGTFDATNTGSPPTGYTVTLTNGTNHTITGTGTAGNTKFHNLSLTGAGGKTLTISKNITVGGDLKLEGTSEGSLLTVQGGTNPSEITLNGHKTGGKWLKVKNDIPIANGGSYMAAASSPDPVSTPPRNWIFTNAQGQIVWTGNVDTNWNTAGNWDPPYATPSEHADVIIKPGQGGRYPCVGQHTGAKAKSVTVENNAKLDLGDLTIKTSGGSTAQLDVESGGHLFLKGSTDQKAWFEQGTPANKMTVQAGSTVEYNGNPSVASNVWEGPYHELIVSGDKTSLAASGMIVNDTFTVNTNGTLTVTAPTQTYKNAVTLNGNTTFAASTSVTFEQNASITGSNSTFAVRGNLKLECASVNVKEISVSGTTEAAGTASPPLAVTAGKQTYEDAVTLKKNSTFTAVNGTLTFKKAVTADDGSNKKDIEIQAGTVNFGEKTSSPLPAVTVNKLTLTAGNVFSYAEISAQNAVLFTVNGSGNCVIRGPVKASSFKQAGNSCHLQIGAPVTNSGGSPLAAGTFNVESKQIYITHSATLDPSSTAWTRPADAAFFIAKDINLANSLSCANFVLFAGTVTMGGTEITAEAGSVKGDIVLFGSAYKANDTVADGASDPSGTQNLFTYNHLERTGMTAEPSVSLPPKLPDGTALPGGLSGGKYSGSFADLTGKKLKAGKNFYANGIELKAETGSNPSWTLDIPNNDNATAAFAEAYFTTVKNCTVTGGSVAAAEKCTDQSGNSGWEFGRPTIEKAYTYSDDTIYVKFNKSIENSNNEIQTAINAGKIRFNDGEQNFKFTSVLKVGTDGKPAGSLPAGDVAEFFLRTDGSPSKRWNTDATGISPGSNQSTDRGGSSPYEPVQNKDPRHQTIKPNLWIPKGTNSDDRLFPNLYISLRDKHKNRLLHYAGAAADASGGNGKIYGKVEDRCPPVLAAVYIGQEPHTVSSQPRYDAHNFIEFRYSEPVFIDGISDNPAFIGVGEKYIRATDTLGNIATDSAKNITEVKGIASFSNGKLDTGKHGGTSGSVHAVYRTSAMRVNTLPVTDKRECRVRISVAGWVDGSVTVGGTSVHNWIGYINEALAPSGSAVPVYTQPSPNPLNTANVRTREPSASDPLKEWEKLDVQFKPKIYASSAVGLPEVGSWDTSPPVFAKASDDSAKWLDTANTSKEITAYSASSQFADKIEFHFFDNTPNYASTALWWQTAGALISHPGWNTVNDRYDSYGGSRFTGSNRTMGGIRACTLPAPGEVKVVFIFDAEKPEFNAALQKFRGTDTAAYPLTLVQKAENEAIFGSRPIGFSEQDSLYLQLRISPPSAPLKFPVTEIFTVGYRGIDTSLNGGRITDLAGNLMKSCADAKSIDASPPNIALTAAPVGLKQIYVLFTSQIDTRPETLAKIPGNFELIDVPAGSTIQIDSSVPARVRTDTKNGTGIIVSLTESVTYNLLTTAKLRVKKDTDNLIHIYPKIGVYPTFEGHKHVISDFAVNIIRPLFAYDERKLDDGTSGFVTAGIYGGTSQAVRLFDGSGIPGNTVLEKEDITVHLAVENVLPGDTSAPTNLELYMENNPNPASVSVNLNKATNLGSRIWLPAITGLPLGAVSGLSVLSPEENPCSSNEVILLSPTVPNGFKYEFKLFNNPLTVPLSPKFLNYPDGSRAEFLFALKNGSNYILIDHDCDDGGSSPTPKIPLYALRLKDPNDPASIDLWSFDISAIKKQAGGVSILNNVINVETGEKCTIAVTAEKAGSLSVMVMTLDGDVVKVLYSGHAEKGEHLYRWNGTNKNGEAVARGMYFIRVLGPGIDETRKVMAIKE